MELNRRTPLSLPSRSKLARFALLFAGCAEGDASAADANLDQSDAEAPYVATTHRRAYAALFQRAAAAGHEAMSVVDQREASDTGGAPAGDSAADASGSSPEPRRGAAGTQSAGTSAAGMGGSEAPAMKVEPYVWQLPPGFPVPFVPGGNPMSVAKVELGRRLFYDKRLSRNQTQACASCHEQALAFTDGRATALGSTGRAHPRSSMSLANVAYAASLTWANPLFAMGVMPEPLERQALLPIYGDSPEELGNVSQSELESRLSGLSEYPAWFAAAFPGQAAPVTALNVNRALAAFERVLLSGRSPFDRFMFDHDDAALSEAAKRGYALFESDRLSCSRCHSGFNLSDHVHAPSDSAITLRYHNTGLYAIDGAGAYPEPNTGVFNVTQRPEDMGQFKAPTLRNIAVTAPYMHDGSIATLSDVLDHYAAGGRTIASGPNAGVGHDNPYKDPLVHGFSLSDGERADVLAFLNALTDREFLENPALGDPWQ